MVQVALKIVDNLQRNNIYSVMDDKTEESTLADNVWSIIKESAFGLNGEVNFLTPSSILDEVGETNSWVEETWVEDLEAELFNFWSESTLNNFWTSLRGL